MKKVFTAWCVAVIIVCSRAGPTSDDGGDLRRAAQAQHDQFSELKFYKLAAKKILDKLKPSGKAE